MRLQVDKLGKVAITVEKDPWDINKPYNRLTIVGTNDGIAYISRCLVPRGIPTDNRNYWIPIGVTSAPIQANSYKLLDAEYELPTTEDAYEGPYLIDNYAYFWVGTGGNVEDKPEYKKIEIAGKDGKSAYTSYAEYVISIGGEPLSESEWSAQFAKLAVLALVQKITINDSPNYPDEEGNINIEIHDGKSAYELAVESGDPNATTITDWLNSLKGKSAYDIAKEEDPSIESIAAWLESLKGKKGNDGAKGDRGPKGDSIIDADVEALLVNNLLEGGESSILTAEMGRQLSLNVIDVISDNSTFVAPTTQEEVGDYGILWFNTTNNTFYYYYWNVNTEEQNVNPPSFQSGSQGVEQENPTQVSEDNQFESVQYVTFLPNPHMLYCDKENEKVVRWDIELGEFVEVASASGGGNLIAMIQGDTLVLKHTTQPVQNPTIITVVAPNTNFAAQPNDTFDREITIKPRNLTDDIEFILDGANANKFEINPDGIALADVQPSNRVAITYKPGSAEVDTEHTATLEIYSGGIKYGDTIILHGTVIAGAHVDINPSSLSFNKLSTDNIANNYINIQAYGIADDLTLSLGETTDFSFEEDSLTTEYTLSSEDAMIGIRLPIYYIGNANSSATLTIFSEEIDTITVELTGTIVSRKEADTYFLDSDYGYRFRVLTDTTQVSIEPYSNYNGSTKYAPSDGVMIVPYKVKDENDVEYDVVKTGYAAFYHCTAIKALVLPDTITKIGTSNSNAALAGKNSNLKYLKIGNGITGSLPRAITQSGGSGVETIDLGKNISALTSGSNNGTSQFVGPIPNCRNLKTLVLRYEGVVAVNNVTFGDGSGSAEVLANLNVLKVYVTNVTSYVNNTNWTNLGFTSDNFYPLSEYEEPSDLTQL